MMQPIFREFIYIYSINIASKSDNSFLFVQIKVHFIMYTMRYAIFPPFTSDA